MKLSATALLAPALIALAACGGNNAAENTADQLEEAAGQSDPAAAQVLENAADAVREGNEAAAGPAAQQALEDAGNAQAGTLPTQPAPAKQAKPHAPGDPVPPPQVEANAQ